MIGLSFGEMIMNFEKIETEDKEKAAELSVLASRIVKEHFDPIIGSKQNDYMIRKFQSVSAIEEQLRHGYQYYFVNDEANVRIGFLAFYKRENELYLSKFYLKKEYRGRGYSKEMLRFAVTKAREINAESITLNVNKNNDAIRVYEKLGFQKIREEQNSIGGGFIMDDFVYELPLKRQC